MRQLVIPSVRVKRSTMDGALNAVFGSRTLRRVHGTSLRFMTAVEEVSPGSRRKFGFRVDISDVPAPVRKFFSGDSMRVTTTQDVTAPAPGRVEVANRIKLHFVGAELFKLRPTFVLEETPEGIFLGGRVRHDAVLPPPLNGIAEAFMMLNSEQELRRFGQALVEAGIVDPIDA